jgi:phosphotransferase system HPr-like phosphotransfer protein
MASFIVKATRTVEYEIPAEGEDAMGAIKQLDDWIADDFEGYEVGARWDFEAK